MDHCGLSCSCASARPIGNASHVVLGTQVAHTDTLLRALADAQDVPLEVLAPGVLRFSPRDVSTFLRDVSEWLTGVEADEVRCVTVEGGPSSTVAFQNALAAPSLAVSAARVEHADLRGLLDEEEHRFHAEYQPIVELAGGRTVGYEALLRGRDEHGARVMPDVLFGAAYEAGWIHVLDRVGRTTALRDAAGWLGEQLLFINFIPTSIYRPEICLQTTEAAARRAGIAMGQLVFEVSETAQVHDTAHLARVFAYYRGRGCRVAIDDLGAGYSSLRLLVELEPDIVKLDRAIVAELPRPVATSIVRSVVDITRGYGGTVLAEGIETAEQAAVVAELGAQLGQGWHFGRPAAPSANGASATHTRR